MKHIHTFESFVNETNKSVNEKEETHIAYINDGRKPGGSDSEIKKDFNLVVKNRTSSGFDVIGKKEDIEAFVDEYGIVLDGEIELSEGFQDLAYWKDYEVDTSPQAGMTKWMSDKCIDMPSVLKCIDKSIDAWNEEAEDGPISKSAEKHIGDLAIQFWKKFRYINGNIITAMIMQES
jgi:hypothetical protein